MALPECWSSRQGRNKARGNHLQLFAMDDFHPNLEAMEDISKERKFPTYFLARHQLKQCCFQVWPEPWLRR